MTTQDTTTATFLEHLRVADEPITLRRDAQPPRWDDEALHDALYAQDPEVYALLGLWETATAGQRARILFQLLRTSRGGMHLEVRETLDRVTRFLFAVLDADAILNVFLALKRVRANHGHTARGIVHYLMNHPEAEDLFRRRRPAVRDSLEHALGKNVLRACAKMADASDEAPYLRRHLLRFAADGEQAKRLIGLLDNWEAPQGETRYTETHRAALARWGTRPERPATVTATNRGDIATALGLFYRGDDGLDLQYALEGAVASVAAHLPRFPGRVALILDASASMRGYGDREFCLLAQSVALRLVLERRCAHLDVRTVGGGTGLTPAPGGETDLAGALLDVLSKEVPMGRPDVVLIVSDGYENRYEGDLARVIATLPQVGVYTPVVFCHTKFTNGDDLTLRRPTAGLPEREFWHEQDLPGLIVSALLTAEGGAEYLREYLLARLRAAEDNGIDGEQP